MEDGLKLLKVECISATTDQVKKAWNEDNLHIIEYLGNHW